MTAQTPISDVVDTLEHATANDDLDVQDVVNEFGRASFAPSLLVIGLVLFSPLSGIPLLSSVSGLLVFLIAGQAALGRRNIWIPSRVRSRVLVSDRAGRAIDSARSIAVWLETRAKPRLSALVSLPASRLLYGALALAGLTLPLLELIPFTSSIVGLSICLIAVALLMRDGVLALAGIILLPLAILGPITAIVAALF